ncbi:ribosome biogenesis/translation initiation ATPase RLI [Candidatus Woesearchaeota archaeon]|nr:ribosome biogenesis/translation initiation ATPase RLI [Candidatus Woesearchaeota archaeon]
MARIAVLHKDKCNPTGCGDHLCIKLCPINRTGADCITKGSDKKPFIDESLCTGCGICVNRCPFGAISVINLPEELKEEPIHRYGKNGFALFSLPSPVFGKVTGIIGKNGIGKSTAIKILAGVLRPNLNNTDMPAEKDQKKSYDKLVEFFKGTEKQVFFEQVRDNKIRTMYKPQNVDLIPKNAKGKVRDLLKRADEKDVFDEVIQTLGLGNVLDNDITNVSGGELQRIAIAATVMRKAELYIFDEPTSYLDIKQRFIVSRFIRDLADENTAVMVIEHDLVALDYMADIINIMYGKPGVFGIVSQPKSARTGINIYLDGYMKEENVRFRDHMIRFDIRPPVEETRSNILTEWQRMSKKLGGFNLSADKGNLFKNEILGVIGENGIGKTSFVKMLAGMLKPDSGEPGVQTSLSYKPQYLDADSDDLVCNVLKEAVQNNSNDIVGPLELKPLLLKRLNELSGGELQRVAIAEALARDAKLILLDEPSAYLDVEQRLVLSKVLSNFASTRDVGVMVVDHDLVFLDYLSHRLLVFEGEPAVKGHAGEPLSMEQGMNALLKEVNITLRREALSGRPRINKSGSQKDKEQKSSGKYYYT